jgi:protein SCO1/2
MSRLVATTAALAVFTLGVPAAAAAQGSFAMDANLAKRGQKVWQSSGCMICHTLGRGQGAGPDLAGVYERRSIEWLTRFLKNTEEMLESDPIAIALLEEYKNIKMPNVKLHDRDIQAVLHYIARETEELRGE